MTYIRTIIDAIRDRTSPEKLLRDSSYSDRVAPARVSPLAIVSDDLKHYPGITEVLEASLNLVTSYYLQALPMSQDVGGAEVTKVLRRLNPDSRGHAYAIEEETPLIFGLQTDCLGLEAITKRNRSYGRSPRGNSNQQRNTNSTASTPNNTKPGTPPPIKKTPVKPPVTKPVLGKSTTSATNKKPEDRYAGIKTRASRNKDLDIGSFVKTLDLTIKTTSGDVSVPVTMTLNTHFVTRAHGADLLSGVTIADTFTERYYDWRAGMISSMDFFFALDMIRRKKRAMIDDREGISDEIQSRREASWVAKSRDRGQLGDAANVMIISETMSSEVAKRQRGPLSSANIRDRVFKDLSLMILMVVDREEEHVTVYYRDIPKGSTHSIKSLATVNKKGGPDILEALTALTKGNKPVF